MNVVDSSNEIAGVGQRKHHSIGDARRTSVPLKLQGGKNDAQAIVMREVIANHTPQVSFFLSAINVVFSYLVNRFSLSTNYAQKRNARLHHRLPNVALHWSQLFMVVN